MIMSFNKPIRRIAVVGTGVIGVNWAAEHLAIRVPHAKSVNLQINGNTKNTVTDGLFYHDLGGSRDLSTNRSRSFISDFVSSAYVNLDGSN
jgi:hypothetical protein